MRLAPRLYRTMLLSALIFCLLSFASAHSAHSHSTSGRRLPSSWHQPNDHRVHALFKRAPATDGVTYASVGSPAWSAAYPQSSPDASHMPTEWRDALNAAVSSGDIPDIPRASNLPNQNPTYPSGLDPNGKVVCSATYKCRNPDDIWDAPDGTIGISFDDGPQPASDTLLTFLKEKQQTVTHFMIGVNILQFPAQFETAFNMGGDIAVHTWTHPYMTTLSNEDVVAQLGWTMELIHNSTGGRVPRYWRPPFGDSDNRVRAIASSVFGLTTVIWNQDTEDWSLTTQGGTTSQKINASMTEWITGPKSPGLIILEHELSDQSVAAFMAAFPVMHANSWKTVSVAQLFNGISPYQNAPSSNGAVTLAGILAIDNTGNTGSASASGSSTGSATSKPSSTSKSASATASSASTSASTTPNAASSTRAMASWSLLSALAAVLMA
ncbi:hypothetical protein C8F01DRAFT_1050292 [Mycena amicta]|nr:hypothetical protein C8F01DRAFT_1050292 [Mycena amicta]